MHDILEALKKLLLLSWKIGDVELRVAAVLLAAAVIGATYVVVRVLRRLFERHAARREPAAQPAIYSVGRIVGYVVTGAGILLALDALGIATSRLAVILGALGVGLGFGLQAVFSNFVSGLILLFDRSLKVGDFVELGSGLHGEVRDIHIRATRVSTNDNVDILVPNSEFVTGRVVNWTLGDATRRLRVPFGVAYGTDKELVKKAALAAAARVPATVALEGDRGPQVWLVAFGASSLDFELVVWIDPEATKQPGATRAAYNWELETQLAAHGIVIPFPQQDLHVRSAFGVRGRDAAAVLFGAGSAASTGAPAPSPVERRASSHDDAISDLPPDGDPPERR